MTRDLDEQVNAIRRELDSLKRVGLLKSSNRNWKKFFSLNRNFLFYPELSSMILKNFVSNTDIKKELSEIWEVNYLYLSWIFVNKESPVDLFIVGSIDPDKVQKYLNEEVWEKDVKFSVIPEKEFNYRLDINDAFLLTVVRDKDAVVLVNKYKKKLEKLV